ncbi:MAG: HD domain-containing protein [Firmicutes bacterium]|nr:HD domain-containing protein [Bacillota bacterium]
METGICEKTIAYIRDLFQGNSGGHGADHTLRVYHNAMMIAKEEPSCDETIVMLAALLHDADDHKLFHTENNANARAFLKSLEIPDKTIETVCEAINSVSFSQNKGSVPRTLEGQIVQDADRLDAIGAVGIARTFAYGGEHGRSMEETVQHFYDKLLLLKDMMNTDPAKRIAGERHAYLVSYLKELEEELNAEK